jgi:prevent-host-death family protein
MDEISIEKARPVLGEIVDRVRFTGIRTKITRNGKPAAVLVAADWLDRVSELGRFPLGMSQVTCPDCGQDIYPDNLGAALDWVLSHECLSPEGNVNRAGRQTQDEPRSSITEEGP